MKKAKAPGPKLRLSPAAIRRIEQKFEISNLLKMSNEDVEKLNIDFFIAFSLEGRSHEDEPPTKEDLEENGDVRELIDAVTSYLGND